MDNSLLLLIGLWLWAGYWMARPAMSAVSIKSAPTWVKILAALIAMFGWPVLFPAWQLLTERRHNRGVQKS